MCESCSMTATKFLSTHYIVCFILLLKCVIGQEYRRGECPNVNSTDYEFDTAKLDDLSPSASAFRKAYERGDFPFVLKHDPNGDKIAWKDDIEKLDYHHYLPLFFDGLCETDYPFDFFAREGVHDMLEHGGSKILPVIPELITPIKNALNMKNPKVMCTTLKVLQHLVVSADKAGEKLVPFYNQILPILNVFKNKKYALNMKNSKVMCTTLKVLQHLVVSADKAGEKLVPFYNQILPILNVFKNKKLNSSGGIDYSQQKQENIGDLIQETLEAFERHGGDDALRYIKDMVPTYKSCMLN